MKQFFQVIVFFILIFITTAQATADPRRSLPPALDQSYTGIAAGYLNIPFTNANLENNLRAAAIVNPHFAPRIVIGHFFNPHIAIQASLMRPINWSHFKNLQYPTDNYSVWVTLFGLTAKPSITLSKKISLYGKLGFGFISRHGFDASNYWSHHVAVHNAFITTLLSGIGLSYALNRHWHLNAGLDYTPNIHSKKQPPILYAYTGFYYVLLPSHQTTTHGKQYHFPLNFIQMGFFTNQLFHANVNQYFTAGGLPIFWDGKVKNRNGAYLMYERNLFHTDRGFSLEWGTSFARYQTHLDGQIYYTFSLFPELKYWFIRGKYADFYFTYSIAGPTYITQTQLDRIKIGKHFIFQDWMGIGVFLGQKKHFNINLKIGHYSNGNLFPENAGIEVPLTISIGYAFN